jgi:hypothetical protein
MSEPFRNPPLRIVAFGQRLLVRHTIICAMHRQAPRKKTGDRIQAARHHHAVVTKIANLPAQPITRRPGLEADVQSIILLSQLLDRPLYRRRIILNLADKPDLAGAAALRDRHRMLLLGYIKRDERFAILSHGSPSVREDRLGPSEQPSSLSPGT